MRYDGVNDLSTTELDEMTKMGGSVYCPDNVGRSDHIIIKFTDPGVRPVLCNVGIFSCSCSNLRATRGSSDYNSNILKGFVSGTDVS